MSRRSTLHLGLAALALAAFLLIVATPWFVSAPSNMRNLVLSPRFWPYILGALMALAGVGLLLSARAMAPEDKPPLFDGVPGAAARLAGMAVLMVAYVVLIPRLGMVWTSMLAFAAAALVLRTKHPKSALIAAIIAPLLLYAFFAHVAGVAVPQGLFVRLP